MRLRTLFLVALSLAALVGGLWYWRKSEAAAARRLAAWEDHERTRATEAILEKRIDWPRATLPLAEFAAVIAKNSGLAVEIDRIALEAEGKDLPSIRIDIPRGTLPIGSVLRLGLSPHDLCYDLGDRRLTITTPTVSHDRNRLRTVVYALPQPEGGPIDEDAWRNLITTVIEPSDWKNVGGRGHCEQVPGGLVIAHTSHAHRQLRRLIDALSKLDADASGPVVLNAPNFADQADRERILAALDEPASVDCQNLSVPELVEYLQLKHGIPIALRSNKLAEGGFKSNWTITARLGGLSLRSLLDHVLGNLGLAYQIREGLLVITTRQDSEYDPTLIAYPVGDLIAEGGRPGFDPLIDLVSTTVVPESWADVGGTGNLVPWGDDWLLVSQSESVHVPASQFLRQLRSALAAESGETVFPVPIPTIAEQRAEEALDQQMTVDWNAASLHVVRQDLEGQLNASVAIDFRELERAELPRITFATERDVARDALRRALEPLGMAAIARGEVLLLTTAYEADQQLSVRLYDVRPLTDPDVGLLDVDELEEFLRKVIDPDSWDERGGPGTTRHYGGLLVVQHKAQTQRRLTSLLTALEMHCLPWQKSGGEEPSIVTLEGSRPQQRIEQLLRENARVDFCGEPLDRALHRLALDHDLPLVFDEDLLTAWSEIDWPPVTLSTARYTLGGILDRMLKPEWLVYEVHDGVLHVTRRIDPAVRMEVRLYRVDGLGGARLPQDLIAAVKPEQWDHGGSFDAALLPTGWLIVATDWARHQRVAEWFEEQRTGRKPRRAIERLDFDVEYPFDPFAVPSVRLPRERPDPSLETNP